jgi:hypothetical protein
MSKNYWLVFALQQVLLPALIWLRYSVLKIPSWECSTRSKKSGNHIGMNSDEAGGSLSRTFIGSSDVNLGFGRNLAEDNMAVADMMYCSTNREVGCCHRCKDCYIRTNHTGSKN